MTILTNHIRAMLAQADEIARHVTDRDFDRDHQHQMLERAANLAEHAAIELRDELLRDRDGWPQV